MGPSSDYTPFELNNDNTSSILLEIIIVFMTVPRNVNLVSESLTNYLAVDSVTFIQRINNLLKCNFVIFMDPVCFQCHPVYLDSFIWLSVTHVCVCK